MQDAAAEAALMEASVEGVRVAGGRPGSLERPARPVEADNLQPDDLGPMGPKKSDEFKLTANGQELIAADHSGIFSRLSCTFRMRTSCASLAQRFCASGSSSAARRNSSDFQ